MLKNQGQNANPRNIAETIVANIPDNNIISKVGYMDISHCYDYSLISNCPVY